MHGAGIVRQHDIGPVQRRRQLTQAGFSREAGSGGRGSKSFQERLQLLGFGPFTGTADNHGRESPGPGGPGSNHGELLHGPAFRLPAGSGVNGQ